jgi:hypothetical protein
VRLLSFALLLTAAFDWPVPWLDRLGVAAAGLACLALAIAPATPRIRRARRFAVPPKRVALSDELDEQASVLAERLAPYLDAEPASR